MKCEVDEEKKGLKKKRKKEVKLETSFFVWSKGDNRLGMWSKKRQLSRLFDRFDMIASL